MKKILKVGLATYHVFSFNDMNVYSGYATLYLLMAMVPLFTLVVGFINRLPEAYLKSFFDIFINVFPDIPQIRDLANDLLSRVDPQSGTIAISVSLLTMLWSASNGVSALQLALMRISGTERSAVKRKISALIYTVLFIILIPALLIFRVFRGSLENIVLRLAELLQLPEFGEAFVSIVEDSGIITVIAMAFIVVLSYTYLQGHAHSLKHQLPGALFTTVLWVLASEVFEWFITEFWSASSLYGSLASIFLTALWLKIILTILFLGASLNEACYLLSHPPEQTAS